MMFFFSWSTRKQNRFWTLPCFESDSFWNLEMAYSNIASKEQFASVLIWLYSGSCKPILRLRIPVKKQTNKQKRSQPYSFTSFNFGAIQNKAKQAKFPARIELATFRVLGGRDNHYTTETTVHNKGRVRGIIGILSLGRTQIHTLTVVQGGGGGGGKWNPSPEFLICCSDLKRFYL